MNIFKEIKLHYNFDEKNMQLIMVFYLLRSLSFDQFKSFKIQLVFTEFLSLSQALSLMCSLPRSVYSRNSPPDLMAHLQRPNTQEYSGTQSIEWIFVGLLGFGCCCGRKTICTLNIMTMHLSGKNRATVSHWRQTQGRVWRWYLEAEPGGR